MFEAFTGTSNAIAVPIVPPVHLALIRQPDCKREKGGGGGGCISIVFSKVVKIKKLFVGGFDTGVFFFKIIYVSAPHFPSLYFHD